MKSLVTLVAALSIFAACGGEDTAIIDGGADAPSDSLTKPDVLRSDAGDAGDAGSSDSGSDGSQADSGGNDSGKGGDSGSGDSGAGDSGTATFACLAASCDSKTDYCHIQEVGPQPIDGGIVGTGACQAYPKGCGAKPNCSCIPTVAPCTCSQAGSDITVTCGGV